jgi:hypothetical protein
MAIGSTIYMWHVLDSGLYNRRLVRLFHSLGDTMRAKEEGGEEEEARHFPRALKCCGVARDSVVST